MIKNNNFGTNSIGWKYYRIYNEKNNNKDNGKGSEQFFFKTFFRIFSFLILLVSMIRILTLFFWIKRKFNIEEWGLSTETRRTRLKLK